MKYLLPMYPIRIANTVSEDPIVKPTLNLEEVLRGQRYRIGGSPK
jgi:hypothetical protein